MTEFMKFATRPSSVVREPPIAFYMTDKGLKRFIVVPIDQQRADYYVDKESYTLALRNIMNEIEKDPQKILKQYEEYSQSLIDKAKKVWENKDADGKTVWKQYDDYYNFIITYSIYFIGTFSIEEFLIPKLARQFPEKINIIVSPGKLFEYQKLRKALFEKPIEQVQKEYGWMNLYNYHEQEYPVSYFEDLKKNVAREDVDAMYAGVEKNEKTFQEFLTTVQDEKLRKECILAHEFTFIKTDRVDAWKKSMQYVRPLFERLAKKQGWTVYETTNLTQEEIKNALVEDTYPSLEQIKLRSAKKCVLDIRGRTLNIICDPSEVEKIKKLVQEKIVETTEFIGTVASPGKAKGPVAVVPDKTHVGKVKKGDILVAIWTIPDYVPAMQKAAAIITEEGGMTSHAAVISRELKKPCLLNVKNATKILKDGDIVEVDANKGVVKKVTP